MGPDDPDFVALETSNLRKVVSRKKANKK